MKAHSQGVGQWDMSAPVLWQTMNYFRKKEMNTQSAKIVSERTICILFSKKILGEVLGTTPTQLWRDIPSRTHTAPRLVYDLQYT